MNAGLWRIGVGTKKRGNVVLIDSVSALLFKMGWHFVVKNQDSFSVYYRNAVPLYVIEI